MRKLKPDSSGPILCFVGPPGVGKTSLGRSIAARARPQVRAHLASAASATRPRSAATAAPTSARCPGTIIRALRDAGSKQPGLHDRRDRQDGRRLPRRPGERDARGARSRSRTTPSATTTSTSPSTSRDVMFIATANMLDPIPGPLRDRMEVIQLVRLHGRREAAHRQALPGPAPDRGERPQPPRRSRFADAALKAIAEEYTREAGVRNLEREIGTVCRKVARERGRGPGAARRSRSRPSGARELLGRRTLLLRGPSAAPGDPGVATGLAWTPVGGEVLFIEATAMPGRRQADDHRSARRRDEGVGAGGALLRARSHLGRSRPGSRTTGSPTHDIHIHVPAGAVPKDGPSAGRGDGDRADLAAHRHARRRRRGDDRRDHADRPGAAGRRPQGEVARRSAGGTEAGDRPGAQRGRDARDPRARARRRSSSSTWRRSARRSRPRSTAAARRVAEPTSRDRRGYARA